MRFLLPILCFFLVHCSTLNVYRSEDQKNFTSAVMKVETSHYLWGFFASNPGLVEARLCADSRIDAVQMGMTGSDVLIGVVTLGIYVPSRATVNCSK